MRWLFLMLVGAMSAGCTAESGTAPTPPAPAATIDVLDFIVGDQALWPRRGDQSQHQTVEGSHVCWTKYALPWMYECWRWDEQWVYHEVDHGIDARRWEYYTLSDGRWLPRHLTVGTEWSLDVTDNRVRWVDAACNPLPDRAMPYRLHTRFEPAFDAGGNLGVRDTLVLEYQPDPEHAAAGTLESFYFAKGAGWFLWTRSDGVRVAFNQIGGLARPPAPLCARDFQFTP